MNNISMNQVIAMATFTESDYKVNNTITSNYAEIVPTRRLLALFICVMGGLDLICNLVVIVVHKYIRNGPLNRHLVIGLACCDVILSLSVIIHVYPVWTGQWPFGEVTCVLTINLGLAALISSILIIMVISLDRYVAVAHPFTYCRMVNHKRVIFVMLLLMFLATCQAVFGIIWNLIKQEVLYYPWCGIYTPNFPTIHVPVMNVVVVVVTILVSGFSLRVLCITTKTVRTITASQRSTNYVPQSQNNQDDKVANIDYLNTSNSFRRDNQIITDDDDLIVGENTVSGETISNVFSKQIQSERGLVNGFTECTVCSADQDLLAVNESKNGFENSNLDKTESSNIVHHNNQITNCSCADSVVSDIETYKCKHKVNGNVCKEDRTWHREEIDTAVYRKESITIRKIKKVKNRRFFGGGGLSARKKSVSSMTERRAVMMLLTLIASFVISFIPSVIIVTLTNIRANQTENQKEDYPELEVVSFVVTMIVPLNGIYNVFVYYIFNRKFRHGLKIICGRVPEVDIIERRMQSVGIERSVTVRSHRENDNADND